jgi:arylsulfatase A-like enzyme
MKVIVIVLRGLHLGYVGCYGNGWIDTPGLDRLSAEGVVFDQHFCDCPEGAAARRAWRTGQATTQQGMAPDLLALLREHGVVSQLLIECSALPASEFEEGWSAMRRVPPESTTDQPLDRLLEIASDGLDDMIAHEHALLWMELAGLIPLWRIPAEYLNPYFHQPDPAEEEETDEAPVKTLEPWLDPAPGPLPAPSQESFLRLQSTYAGAVSMFDGVVGWLLEQLSDRKLDQETLVAVTTNHGQALGEHGIIGPYRPWLHDELIHVPLLMRLPGGAEAGRRVATLTQSVDLFPTLLDAFSIAPPPCHGYSLLPLARGDVGAVRSHVCCGLRLGEREEWALRTPEWSFLLPVAAAPDDPPRTPQLYIKPDDRWEVNNVIQHQLELAERFEQTLRTFMAAPRRIGLETPWIIESGGIAT